MSGSGMRVMGRVGRRSRQLPTPSELAILRHKVNGRTDETIARILGLAERTVRRQLESLSARLAVNSRAELFVEVGRRGWLDLDLDKDLPTELPPEFTSTVLNGRVVVVPVADHAIQQSA